MSTNAQIGMQLKNGKINAIYLHWDGYPSHALVTLKKYYNDPKLVKKLIALGDLSSLGNTIGKKHDFDSPSTDECTFYGRDRGETGVGKTQYENIDTWIKENGAEYYYLFDDNLRHWTYMPNGKNEND